MEHKPHMISGAQLVFLLVISRLFSLFTLVPRTQAAASGSTALLCIPLAGLAAGILLLPFLSLQRRSQDGLLAAAFRVNQSYGVVVAVLFLAFCIYMAAFTISHFSFFMASTVYPNATPWIFLLLLILAAAYGASLGLEAFSRMGVWIFFLLLLVLFLFLCALVPEINLAYLTSPFLDGMPAVGKGVLYTAVNQTEAVLLLLLLPRVRRGGGKTAAGWLVLAAVFYEIFSFLALTTLGDYAKSRMFPLHSLASLAQLSVFGRLDLLYIAVWIFAAFLRTAAWFYCAAVCLRRIAPKLPLGWACTCCALGAGLGAFATAGGMQFWNRINRLGTIAVPFFLLVVAVPLATLALTGGKKTSGGKEDAK